MSADAGFYVIWFAGLAVALASGALLLWRRPRSWIARGLLAALTLLGFGWWIYLALFVKAAVEGNL
jgi:hypothetical protein